MVRTFEPDYVDTEPPEINFIVVKDHEISEIQYNQSKRTWNRFAPLFSVVRNDAIIPSTLNDADRNTPLNFFRKAPNKEWQCWREFTETEKCIWYSHAAMWKKCIDEDKPIIVLEQDCVLLSDLNWKIFAKWEMVCFSSYKEKAWPANGYYITPTAAKFLLRVKDPIDHNVDSWIDLVCKNIGEYRFFAKHLSTVGNGVIIHSSHIINEEFRKL